MLNTGGSGRFSPGWGSAASAEAVGRGPSHPRRAAPLVGGHGGASVSGPGHDTHHRWGRCVPDPPGASPGAEPGDAGATSAGRQHTQLVFLRA